MLPRPAGSVLRNVVPIRTGINFNLSPLSLDVPKTVASPVPVPLSPWWRRKESRKRARTSGDMPSLVSATSKITLPAASEVRKADVQLFAMHRPLFEGSEPLERCSVPLIGFLIMGNEQSWFRRRSATP